MKTNELIKKIRSVVHMVAPPAQELLIQAADALERQQDELDMARAERDAVTQGVIQRAVDESGGPKVVEIDQLDRWIPVRSRLPEYETPVLICIRICGDVFARVGWLHESGMWSVPTSKKWILNSVTHWMPLPEPPKEGA